MKRKNNHGFTLPELLAAVVILAITLIAGSAFYYSNRKNITLAKMQRLAMWSATDRMEQWKKSSYNTVQNLTESLSVDNVPCSRITTVTTITEGNISYKEVRVELRRTQGNLLLTTISTYIAP
ncbi:MAG: prepilin-type N-terminal cleavage/methylation domain-containing protein [Candidatus Ratteibacteria bacterium]|jgi:prepilin-type N-terminal cleavage/methylation domain-containing protein